MELLAKGIVVPTAGAHAFFLCYTAVYVRAEDVRAEDVCLHDVHH